MRVLFRFQDVFEIEIVETGIKEPGACRFHWITESRAQRSNQKRWENVELEVWGEISHPIKVKKLNSEEKTHKPEP